MARLGQWQFHWLLQLPPALRCRVVSPLARDLRDSPIIIKRQFSRSTLLCSRQATAKGVPSVKPASRPVPKPILSGSPPPRLSRGVAAELAKLLEDTGQVLLYRAPRHRSFIISSYIFGTLLISSSVIHASFTRQQEEMRWYNRSLIIGLAVFLAGLGTAFILAPTKMIRSVSLVQDPAGGMPLLRLATRPNTYSRVGGKNTFDVKLNTVRIDTAIRGNELPDYYNVPLRNAQEFTESRSNIGHRSKSNFFQRFVWDVRRMFLRDGMVYMSFDDRGGNWKLDLRDAEILDHARPLTATMVVTPLDRSLFTRVKNRLVQ